MQTKSPAFQFYYKEWLTGTKGMSRVEKDIYLTLIIYQFDFKNKLPKDETELIRICEAKGKKEIESLKYIISKKFQVDGDFLVNRKMSDVITEQDLYRQKQANNGSLGGRPKKAVGYSGLSKKEPKESSVSIPTTTTTDNTNTLKGAKHFEHIFNFHSLPYEQQETGFRQNYTAKEYDSFYKFLTALFREFNSEPNFELQNKFDKCISIGDWKKYLKASGYLIIKPFVIKAIGAPDGDRNNMAARIATYSNGAFDEKIFMKS